MGVIGKAATAALVFAFALSAPALADTFTTTSTNGGDGFASFPSGVDVDLFGSDNGVGPSLTTYTATALSDQTFFVTWNYHTEDTDGPHFDPAGYVINDVLHPLTDDGGSDDQSGSFLVSVLSGQVYGIYVDSTDSDFGRADLSVTASETPLPAALPLFASVLGGMGLLGWRRRRKIAVTA
jgi:hypothetical protein